MVIICLAIQPLRSSVRAKHFMLKMVHFWVPALALDVVVDKKKSQWCRLVQRLHGTQSLFESRFCLLSSTAFRWNRTFSCGQICACIWVIRTKYGATIAIVTDTSTWRSESRFTILASDSSVLLLQRVITRHRMSSYLSFNTTSWYLTTEMLLNHRYSWQLSFIVQDEPLTTSSRYRSW